MTHITPGGAAQRADFAGGEGWKVVVMHVTLGIRTRQAVDLLGIAGRTECGQGEYLGLTTGE